MTTSRSKQRVPWALYGFVIGVAIVLAVVDLGGGITDQGLQLLTRHTARFSFALFLVVFVASSAASLTHWPAARMLVRRRRHLGLAFALAHFIHLGALTSFFVLTPAEPDAIAIVGGGFGYVLLAALAITSNDAMMRRLGRNWKRLHTFGVYYLWFIFAQSYVGRVFASDSEANVVASPKFVYVVLLSLAMLALAARLARRFQKRLRVRKKGPTREHEPMPTQ
jgi:DMSO/TMAO reductase YedYZ heme-binding membrane subunit